MARVSWRGRIVIAQSVCREEPCFKGTQVPVKHVLSCLADGMTPQQVVQEFPQITEDDVWAALSYATDAVAHGLTPEGPRGRPVDPEKERLLAKMDRKRLQRAIDSGKIEILGPRKWRYHTIWPPKDDAQP